MNWKLWSGIAVVVVIALVLFGTQKSAAPEQVGTEMPVPGTDTPDTAVSPSPSPTAAGTQESVDSIIDGIFAGATGDQTLVQAEDANADLAMQDTADLNDLGAAYSGNEF